MRALFDPSTLARTYRDPVAVAILAVDLFPVYAVLTLGWGAGALVFLYWLENLVVGGFALARMLAAAMKEHPIGAIGMLFIAPFFIFHYGMFAFVHGIFVNTFASMGSGGSSDFLSPFGLVRAALNSAAHMPLFIWAIIVLQGFLFVRDFILRGEYRETTVQKEMMAPYARVLVLHIGLFAGMGAMIVFGEPMFGILGLIGLRAVWGAVMTVQRRYNLDHAAQKS